MECMVGLTKQNVLLLFFAPTKGAQMLIATSSGDKGVTDAVTEIEINDKRYALSTLLVYYPGMRFHSKNAFFTHFS